MNRSTIHAVRLLVKAILALFGIEMEIEADTDAVTDRAPTPTPPPPTVKRGSYHRVKIWGVSPATALALVVAGCFGLIVLGTWALGHPLWHRAHDAAAVVSTTEVK
jgi:hypothetical protein